MPAALDAGSDSAGRPRQLVVAVPADDQLVDQGQRGKALGAWPPPEIEERYVSRGMGTDWPTAAVTSERAAGAVLASASGDALGAPHEFGAPLPPEAPLRMTGGGPFGWKPGEWTDDTQVALCLLAPLAQGDLRISAVEDGFLNWYESRPADVGSQTRAVLSGGRPLATAARSRYASQPTNSGGNGGLMRIAPAPLSSTGDRAAIAVYAAQTTQLTHADPDCVDASVLWALAIDHAIHSAPPSEVSWDFAGAVREGLGHLGADRQHRWSRLIDEAIAEQPTTFSKNGWVVHAFQAALSAIVHTPIPTAGPPCGHLVVAIESAVRVGGDTDTVAAIAGALLGARWGATAIPSRWRSALRGKHLGANVELAADGLDVLARRARRGGRTDMQGWPGCPQMVPYYLQAFNPGPQPADLGGARFGGVGGLASVLEDGTDVVVSLCRMGSNDVPPGIEHHVVGLIDSKAEDNPNLAFVLADTSDLIANRVAAGRSVYVHCVAAENRTPAVAAACLARVAGLPVADALARVTETLGHTPKPFLVEGVEAVAGLPRSVLDGT
jgi:ADP-ribosyl-[dinitrogen reductase] hydrolase